MSYTARGFRIYAEFMDSVGVPVRVQECSCTEEACWVFVEDPGHVKMHVGAPLYPALHLAPDQARQLIAALQEYLDASIEED